MEYIFFAVHNFGLAEYTLKRLWIFFSVLFVLIIAGVMVAPSFIEWTKFKDQIIAQVEKETGFDLKIGGELDMALLPFPRIMVEDLALSYPEKYKQDDENAPFLTVKKIRFQADLLPLLQGQVVVKNVLFEVPDVRVDVNEKGELVIANIALSLLKKDEKKAEEKEGGDNNPFKNSVALNQINIKDGVFHYNNRQKSQIIEVKDINLALQAETLNGPFIVDGGLHAYNTALDVYVKTGRIDNLSESMALQVEASIPNAGGKLSYSGVFAKTDKFELQGETALDVENIQKFALMATGKQNAALPAASLSTKGILTWDGKKAAYQNLQMNINKEAAVLNGSATAELPAGANPAKVAIKMEADKQVDLDVLIPSLKPQGSQQKAATGFVPQKLALPMDVDFDVALTLGAVRLKGMEMSSGALSAVKAGKKIEGRAALSSDVTGRLDAEYSVVFRGQEKGAGNAVILSNPLVTAKVNADMKRLKDVAALAGASVPKAIAEQPVTLDTALSVVSDTVTVKHADLNAFGSKLSMSTTVTKGKDGGRDKIVLSASANGLNLDDILTKMDLKSSAAAKKTAKTSFEDKLRDILAKTSMPFDYDVSLSLSKLTYLLTTHDTVALKARSEGRMIAVEGANLVNKSEGMDLTVSGKIADTKELSGVALNLSFDVDDWKKTAERFGAKLGDIRFDTGKAQVVVEAKGGADKLDFTANLKALQGSLDVSGKVSEPMAEQPGFSDLVFRLRHPNYVQLVQAYHPSFYLANGDKPALDIYSKVDSEGKEFKFQDVKAQIGSLKAVGDVVVNTSGKVPSVSSNFQFDRFDLLAFTGAKKASSGSKGGKATSSAKKGEPSVRWSRSAINTAWLHAANVDVNVKGNHLSYGAWELEQPVMKARIKDGTLTLEKLDAKLFSGTASVKGEIKSALEARQPISISGDLKLDNVFLDDVTRAFSGARILKAKGLVSADAKLKTSGLSPAALIFDLSGQGKVSSSGIIVQGFDLDKMAATLVSPSSSMSENLDNLTQSTSGKGNTELGPFEGSFTINEGIVSLSGFDFKANKATISTTGQVNLPLWTLALNNAIKLTEPEGVPPLEIKFEGPIDQPAKTFGEAAIEQYIRSMLESKVEEVLYDTLIKKGILPPNARKGQATGSDSNTGTDSGTSDSGAANDNNRRRMRDVSPEEALFGILQNVLEQ